MHAIDKISLHWIDTSADGDDDYDEDDAVDDQYHSTKRYTFARWNNYFKLLLTILSRNTVWLRWNVVFKR